MCPSLKSQIDDPFRKLLRGNLNYSAHGFDSSHTQGYLSRRGMPIRGRAGHGCAWHSLIHIFAQVGLDHGLALNGRAGRQIVVHVLIQSGASNFPEDIRKVVREFFKLKQS